MSSYDTTAIIAQARRLAFTPTASATGTADSDIIAHLNFVLFSALVPKLRAIVEEYFVTKTDVLTSASVDTYAIPTRAAGNSLRDISVLRTDNSLLPLPRIDIPDLPRTGGINPTTAGIPQGFYPLGDNVVLFPSPASGFGYLRMHYERRPNDLILTSAACQVLSINTSTGVVTMTAAVPVSGAGAFTSSTPCDFIKGKPHFSSLNDDKTPSNVSGSTITFALADLPATLAAGDYVCLSGQSPVPQVPYELHPLLTQHAVCKLLEANGATERLSNADAKLKEIDALAFQSITPRFRGKTKVVNAQW